jgi:hypothetical protein
VSRNMCATHLWDKPGRAVGCSRALGKRLARWRGAGEDSSGGGWENEGAEVQRGTAGSRHTDLGVAAEQVQAATARGG